MISHLLVTLAKLGARAGLGALVAESLAVKHQLVIMKRAQRRAPNLTSWDRLALGGCALLVPPKGQSKMAVILKPSTLLCFHHALVKRFHRWLANLRVLEVDEIKAIPCTPRSHAFVERLIGRYGAYLDRTLFWNQSDLERKLENHKAYYNQHRCHSGLAGASRLNGAACPDRQSQHLSHIPGGNIATAYFRPQLPHELEFDTDTSPQTAEKEGSARE